MVVGSPKQAVSVADMLAWLRRALLAPISARLSDQHTLDLFPDALLTQFDPADNPEHE
jgi:hypothetical protein